MDRISVRTLGSCDLLIFGADMSACLLALEYARKGIRVCVVTRGTSLGEEAVLGLRPWVKTSIFRDETDGTNEPYRQMWSALRHSIRDEHEGFTYLHTGRLSEYLEDLLLDNGITFLYGVSPAGILEDETAESSGESTAAGVALAGKFGMGLYFANCIVDTSPDGVFPRIGGARPDSIGPTKIDISLTIHSSTQGTDGDLIAPSGAIFRRRYDFIEYTASTSLDPGDDFFLANAGRAIREALLHDMMEQREDLNSQLGLDRTAETLQFEKPFLFSGGLGNVISWNPGAEVPLPDRDIGAILDSAAGKLSELGGSIDGMLSRVPVSGGGAGILHVAPSDDRDGSGCSAFQWRVDDPGFSEPGEDRVTINAAPVPKAFDADVLVAGAGTSGFPAALVSAQKGCSVVCFDARTEPGGTNTIGGVSKYWFGNWTPFFRCHLAELLRREARTGLPRSMNQFAMLLEAGVRFLPSVAAAGVVSDGTRMEGVLVTSSAGLRFVSGKTVIDATGDGDLAAWAGCPYTYGAGRDEITLWYSFGKYHGGRNEASRLFNAVVDQRSARDASRAMVTGRRQIGIRGEAEYPVYYLAPRETRHITGKIELSYLDMLMNRAFADTVYTCRSNIDIKGLSGSDAAFIGIVEENFLGNYHMRVPYRALLPADGPANLIVTGKAYSITHDGLSMARMVIDMIGLGGVSGHAAVLALKSNGDFNAVDVGALQEQLLGYGLVTHSELAEEPVDGLGYPDRPFSEEELMLLVRRLAISPTDLIVKAAVLSAGSRVIPHLLPLLDRRNRSTALMAAKYLCYLGSSDGNDLLLAYLEEEFRKPDTFNFASWRHKMPDHGYAPVQAYAVYALALVRDDRLTPLLADMVRHLPVNEPLTDGTFNLLHAASYAFERMASPESSTVVEEILRRRAFGDVTLEVDDDPRHGVDIDRERYAYLRMCFSRSLARCGSERGYLMLIDLLSEQRVFIARAALAELEDLSSQKLGWDKEEWRAWVASEKPFRPIPYTRRHV